MTNSPEQIARQVAGCDKCGRKKCPGCQDYTIALSAARLSWQAGKAEAFGECAKHYSERRNACPTPRGYECAGEMAEIDTWERAADWAEQKAREAGNEI